MSTPADIDALAEELLSNGYLVLRSGEIEAPAAALVLGCSPRTLKNWRFELRGPSWRLVHGLAFYRLENLLAWKACAGLGSAGTSEAASSAP